MKKCYIVLLKLINGQNTSMNFTRAREWYSWHFKSTWHDVKILRWEREKERERERKRERVRVN